MADRRGRFRVSTELLRSSAFDVLTPMFAGVIPCETRYRFEDDSIEFLARGAMFDEVQEGQIAPEYFCIISSDDRGRVVKVTWERV